MALCWTLPSMFMFLFHLRPQTWTQHSRCGLTSAEKRGRIISLNMLAQPRVPLATFVAKSHCWLTFSLVTTRRSQVLFCHGAFQLGDLQHVLVPGIVPPHVLNFALFVELHEVPITLFLLPSDICLDDSTTSWCMSRSFQSDVVVQTF